MRSGTHCLLGIAALLAACVTSPPQKFPAPTDSVPIERVQVRDRFDTVTVNAETLGPEVKRCIAQIEPTSKAVTDMLKEFPSANTTTFRHLSSSRLFVLRQTTGVCIERTLAGYPILAAEAFFETANPNGVPPDVSTGWYRLLAQLIAEKGVAKIAYVYAGGQAAVCSYWVDASAATKLSYSMEHRKKGEWEREQMDGRFAHPNLNSVSQVKRNGQTVKPNPIAHRVL